MLLPLWHAAGGEGPHVALADATRFVPPAAVPAELLDERFLVSAICMHLFGIQKCRFFRFISCGAALTFALLFCSVLCSKKYTRRRILLKTSNL